MEVNNFLLLKKFLKFENRDDFYFLQILQRSKDNPDLGANNRLIKAYSVGSIEYLNKKEKEIKLLCKTFNARAYIHLTKRSYKDVALEMLQNLVQRIRCNQMEEVYKCFTTACGISYQKEDKSWIVDIDGNVDHRTINTILRFIETECEPIGPKFIALVPTVNGHHLITTPFNLQKFSEQYPEIDVHKNNPTLLYYKN